MDTLTALTQMSPESLRIIMQPANYQAMGDFLFCIFAVILFVAVIGTFIDLINKATESRKTQNYRKVVADMFVAGTIRKLAEEDKIDLDEEYKKFQKYEKKQRNKEKDLDQAIEANLKDKVTEKTEAEIEKVKSAK